MKQKEPVEGLRKKYVKGEGSNGKRRDYIRRNVCFLFTGAHSYWYYFIQLS